MKNIYIVRLSSESNDVRSNYYSSINKKISYKKIEKYFCNNPGLKKNFSNIFGNNDFNIWGTSLFQKKTEKIRRQNLVHFNKMCDDDYIMFVLDDHIKYLGEIAFKINDPLQDKTIELTHSLEKEFWGDYQKDEFYGLIYFICNLEKFNFPFIKFKKYIGFKLVGNPHGFTSLEKNRLYKFYSENGNDLYEFLKKLEINK